MLTLSVDASFRHKLEAFKLVLESARARSVIDVAEPLDSFWNFASLDLTSEFEIASTQRFN